MDDNRRGIFFSRSKESLGEINIHKDISKCIYHILEILLEKPVF
jgi:hypothetical protein